MHNAIRMYMFRSLPNPLHLQPVGLDHSLLVLVHSLCEVDELCHLARHNFTAAMKLVCLRRGHISRILHRQHHQRSCVYTEGAKK